MHRDYDPEKVALTDNHERPLSVLVAVDPKGATTWEKNLTVTVKKWSSYYNRGTRLFSQLLSCTEGAAGPGPKIQPFNLRLHCYIEANNFDPKNGKIYLAPTFT